MTTVFSDTDLQFELLAALVFDRQWLRAVGDVVTQEDFYPLSKSQESMAWVVAGVALTFYRNHRVPVGSLIQQELARWAKESGAGEERQKRTREFLIRLKQSYDPSRSTVLQEQVLGFKKTRARQKALQELVELERQGGLTDDRWLEVMRSAANGVVSQRPKEWTETLDSRIQRRSASNSRHLPALLIDPLDVMVRSIGPGHVGLWLAFLKMGKSLAMIWTATSYLFQGLNVLFITLEDPLQDVEDRFDACVAEMRIVDLGRDRDQLHSRFALFKEKLRSKLRIFDGTDGQVTIQQIESLWERERALGFDADVVIVDYDDEIKPVQRRPDPRQESSDIYRDYRKFCARRQVIGWIAAQANRAAEGRKVISSGFAAEDIGKIRKVTMAIGIGQGEWGDDSKYLFVAAHKFDRQLIGCNIFSAPDKGIFYDRMKTLQQMEDERRSIGTYGEGI